MTNETMRAEFERWEIVMRGSLRNRLARDDDGYYYDSSIADRWFGYSQGATAERTRCAAIARAAGREDIATEIKGAGE